MSRRFAGAGLLRRAARTSTAVSALNPITELGADLLYWWEASAATVTLNGSTVAQVNERVGGARHLVQATGANQMLWEATGGPNGRPCLTFNDTGDTMLASALTGIADGNRVGVYNVAAVGGTANIRYVVETLNAANGLVQSLGEETNEYRFHNTFTGGAQAITPATPARDTNFHVFASRPLATGALSQVDGTTTNVTFTGTDTLDDQTQVRLGRNTASAGKWCSTMLVVDPTDAKNTIVLAYYAQVYGL